MEWLRALLKAAGKKPADLARALGKPPSRISEMLRGARRMQQDEIGPTARLLDISEARVIALLTSKPDPGPTRVERAADSAHITPQIFKPEPISLSGAALDVPVWASAEAGADGAMVLTDRPIDYIRRSERMVGVTNPFSFFVRGHSMEDVIAHGDMVVVNPNLPARPGNDCVFVSDDGDGNMLALVKRLVRSTADAWIVKQYCPKKQYSLPKKKWAKAFVITEKRYG